MVVLFDIGARAVSRTRQFFVQNADSPAQISTAAYSQGATAVNPAQLSAQLAALTKRIEQQTEQLRAQNAFLSAQLGDQPGRF